MTDKEINRVVKHLGEWIFPQKKNLLAERFSEAEIIEAIEKGWIMQSRSQMGASVQAMRKKAGYIELTESGWELYKSKFPDVNTHPTT